MRLHLATAAVLLLIPLTVHAQRDPLPRRTNVPERPVGPATVVATVSAPGEVTVTWEPVEGATAYDIGRLAPPDGWRRVTRVDGGVTRYVDGGRDLARPHTYQVTAILGNIASMPTRSAELPANAAAGGAPVTAPVEPPLQPAACNPGYVGGRVICYSAERLIRGDFSGGVELVAECEPGTYVLSGGWIGKFRGSVTTSAPRHVSAWMVTIQVPFEGNVAARQDMQVRAIAVCMKG